MAFFDPINMALDNLIKKQTFSYNTTPSDIGNKFPYNIIIIKHRHLDFYALNGSIILEQLCLQYGIPVCSHIYLLQKQ